MRASDQQPSVKPADAMKIWREDHLDLGLAEATAVVTGATVNVDGGSDFI
jgi:hypothetical protein